MRSDRPWGVTALAALLVIETLGFAALAIFLLRLEMPEWTLYLPGIRVTLAVSSVVGVLAAGLAGLALLSAAGFLALRRVAWMGAAFVQGATLLAALLLRFNTGFDLGRRTLYAYLLYLCMVCAISMVAYLHTADVREAFAAGPNGQRRANHDG